MEKKCIFTVLIVGPCVNYSCISYLNAKYLFKKNWSIFTLNSSLFSKTKTKTKQNKTNKQTKSFLVFDDILHSGG